MTEITKKEVENSTINSIDFPQEIEVKRISRPGYFGITAFDNSVTTLGCPLTEKGFKTGLTPEEETIFEKALGLKSGELGRHSEWWSNVFNVKYPIRLFNTKPTKFILDNTINKLKYKVMLASNKISNSELEKNPESDFYINNKELKAKVETESFNFKFAGMEKILKMTPEEKRDALRIFGKSGIDNASETMMKSELGRILEKDPKKFVDTLEDLDIALKAWIYELAEKQILKRVKDGFKYNDDTLGSTMEATVEFFKNPKNYDTKLILETALSKIKKGTKK